MPDDDWVATTLAGIRQRNDWASDRYAEVSELRESLADVPLLVAAVEAVLKAADGWKYIHSAKCARELHAVITAKLTKEAGDGTSSA